MSLKCLRVPLESLGTVSYSRSIVTMVLSRIIFEINEILVENRDFFKPTAFVRLPR